MDYNFDTQQLNILVGQAFNNAVLILIERKKDILGQVDIYKGISGFHEELVYLTKVLAQDILQARQEFAGELPDNKIIEAMKAVNKANPKISLEITDFEKASEPQKTLIQELKLMLNRLDNPEMRTTTPRPEFHEEFGKTARKHFNPEENTSEELLKVGNK
jgi:hypothetical protein